MRLNQEIWYFGEPTVFAIAIPIAFALTMATTAFAPAWIQWPFANRGVRWLGNVSYGVFLYHIIVLQVVVRVLGLEADHRTSTVLTILAIVLPVSLLLGWLSLKLVEAPANRWTRRALTGDVRLGWRRRAPTPAPERAN
jgi:peptidoglycan/LPS O-acetylase OafA/YrhL